MKFKRILSSLLALSTMVLGTASTVGSVNAASVETDDRPAASAAAVPAETSGDEDVKSYIENGTILHAFCWSFDTIRENMADIAAAGYTAVQTSPASACYSKYNAMKLLGQDKVGYDGHEGAWWWQYQPTELVINNYQLGGEKEYRKMCEEAHEYGVKIITDIVANHTTSQKDENGNYAVSQNYIDAVGGYDKLYHTKGLTDRTNKSVRDQVINYRNGGLPDINTENPYYQAYLLKYLNTLIDCGCDGFRFDMALNIGLPSDEDSAASSSNYNFWKIVTGQESVQDVNGDVVTLDTNGKTLFYYGEILGTDSSYKLSEYGQYIKITNSNYGSNLRDYIKNRRFSKDKVENWNHTLSIDNLVTWVESHDSYCNLDPVYHESGWMSDQQIRQCWAVIAARSGGTPLFFSRPDGSDGANGDYWGNNELGAKGNDQFKDPEVAAVNKFRTAMIGEGEYLRNINNSQILQIDRGTKGTCIINLSDSDLDIDSETTMSPGTYIDTVSKTIFTVYANGSKNYIRGRIYAGAIATVYLKTNTEISAEYENSVFDSKLGVTAKAYYTNQSGTKYNQNGKYYLIADGKKGEEQDFTFGEEFTIGEELKTTYSSKNIKLVLQTWDPDNNMYVEKRCDLLKQSSDDNNYIYFDNTSRNWSTVYAYIYIDDNTKIADWPGVKLTEQESANVYKYELPYKYRNCQVIFTDNGNDAKRYPPQSDLGLYTYGKSMILGDNNSWEEYPVVNDKTDDNKQDVSTYSYVYFFNNSGWSENQIRVNLWNDSIGEDNGIKKYMTYSDSLHCYYLKYSNDLKLDKARFINGTNTSEDSGSLTLRSGEMYVQNNDGTGEWSSFKNIVERKIYFKDTNSWYQKGRIYVYMWNSSRPKKADPTKNADNADWPGDTLKEIDSTNHIYSYTYYTLKDNEKYDKVIFSKDSTTDKAQTNDLDLPDFSNGGSYLCTAGTVSNNKCTGTWSKVTPQSGRTISVTLNYYDHKVDSTANVADTQCSRQKNISVTANSTLDSIVADAVKQFQMNNLYETYVFHTSEFEYAKTIADTVDNDRIGSNLTYAARIEPKYFAYQTSAFSGKNTQIESLAAAKSTGVKWVTYKYNGSEVLPENVKYDLSNVDSIEVWGYSLPNSYYVQLHYPTSVSQKLPVKLTENLYTARYATGMQPEQCYYNQLINQNGENLTSNMTTPAGYTFDGWYMIDFDDNSYVKVSSEKDFACRVTSDINLYAVFRDENSSSSIGAAATANNVDVYNDNSSTKYRFNTMLNIYDYGTTEITDVAVIYVKLNSAENSYNVNDIRTQLSTFVNTDNTTGSISINSSTVNLLKYSYSVGIGDNQVQLTNKKRIQFMLNLTETQIQGNYSNVLAFTAFKSGSGDWTISDNCAAYKDGAPKTIYISH